MKKLIALVIALALTLSLTAALADTITIAVPNDPTNEGRALLLLQSRKPHPPEELYVNRKNMENDKEVKEHE